MFWEALYYAWRGICLIPIALVLWGGVLIGTWTGVLGAIVIAVCWFLWWREMPDD